MVEALQIVCSALAGTILCPLFERLKARFPGLRGSPLLFLIFFTSYALAILLGFALGVISPSAFTPENVFYSGTTISLAAIATYELVVKRVGS